LRGRGTGIGDNCGGVKSGMLGDASNHRGENSGGTRKNTAGSQPKRGELGSFVLVSAFDSKNNPGKKKKRREPQVYDQYPKSI